MRAHDAQHLIRLPDADLEKEHAVFTQGIAPLFADHAVKVEPVRAAVKRTARLERAEFPEKDYDGFSLPAGEYLALRVVIGEGQGRNWWCVVFPPLCTAAASDLSRTALGAGLTEDDLSLITGDGDGYVLRFRSLELWERLRQWLGK